MTLKHDELSATWTSDDGYSAEVRYSARNGDRNLWRWELFWPGGQLESTDDGRIGEPGFSEPLDVLATLASFLGAWQEAIDYDHRNGLRSSENRDLFPDDAEEFLPAIDEFGLWGYDHENPEED